MKKRLLIILLSTLFSFQCLADNYEACQGNITAIDDILSGYTNVAGGILVITMNGSGCDGYKFWYEDDNAKTKNLISIAMTAFAANKQVRLIYDEIPAYYGTNGKIHRITTYK